MKKIDRISKIIITILAFLIIFLGFRNNDSGWTIVAIIFAAVIYGLSFISTKVAHKIIEAGNRKSNIFTRVLYYAFLPIILFAIAFGAYAGTLLYIFPLLPDTREMGEAIGQAVMFGFAQFVIVFEIIIPYFQAIIILILKKIIK